MMEQIPKQFGTCLFLCPYLKHRIFHVPYYHDFYGAAKSFSS